MVTERQIRANRANAAKSTGPATPEAELEMARARQDAAPAPAASGAVLAAIAFRTLADSSRSLALMHRFEARTGPARPSKLSGTRKRSAERGSVVRANFSEARTGPARPSKLSGTRKRSAERGSVVRANFSEARTGPARPSKLSGTRKRSAERGSVVRANFSEAGYDRQYNRALALLLKLRQAPDPGFPVDPLLQLATETWDDNSQNETNFDADPGKDPTCNEQVPDITPNVPRFVTKPISPKPISPTEDGRDPITDARGGLTEFENPRVMLCPQALQRPSRRDGCSPRLQQPAVSGVRMPDTHYEDTRHENDLGRTTIAKSNRPPLAHRGAGAPRCRTISSPAPSLWATYLEDRRAWPGMPCPLKWRLSPLPLQEEASFCESAGVY